MKLRKLYWDIEMLPGVFYGWSMYSEPFQQIENTTISMISYRWDGEDEVHSIHLNEKQYNKNIRNEKPIIKEFLKVVNQADVMVAHNGDKFDWKKFNFKVAKYNLKPVKKPILVDTLKMVKQEMSADSHRLGDLCREFNLPVKIPLNGGFTAAFRGYGKYLELVNYNRQDIICLEMLYNYIKPHCRPKYDVSKLDNKNRACSSCGSCDIIKYGKYILATGKQVSRYRCKTCKSTKTRDSANGIQTIRAL